MVGPPSPERSVSVQVRLHPPMKHMNNKKIIIKLKRFLSKGGMVHGMFPSRQGVIDVVTKQQMEPIRLLYGETYDSFGITVDSLRYYLFLGLFHMVLQKLGVNVQSTVLIADTASTINPSAGEAQRILEEGKRRLTQVNKIIQIYHLPIRAQLMSELFQKQETQHVIYDTQRIVSSSPDIQSMLQKTVLRNRVHQEQKTAYKYGAEAIATAFLFDIKIGPPRERFYDETAAVIAKKLHRESYASMYLTPTYPLGLDFVYFLLHPEIEAFGLTPYKAGSNNLQEQRIVLGKTPIETVRDLIDSSFVPKTIHLPNPVADLLHIGKMARMFLDHDSLNISDFSILQYEDAHEVKENAGNMYQTYIDEPLRKVFASHADKGEHYEK